MEDKITKKIESLETRLAFQDDLIQKLDDALADQQQQLMTMAEQIKMLIAELKKIDWSPGEEANAPPPHY